MFRTEFDCRVEFPSTVNDLVVPDPPIVVIPFKMAVPKT